MQFANTQTANQIDQINSPLISTLPINPGERVIQSRFGEITINTARAIFFPHGLMGLPSDVHFCLADYPSQKLNQYFRLLQCLEDENLCFIVMPVELETLVEKEDIDDALTVLNIPKEYLLTLLIVSVHEEKNHRYSSVNLRAPLFLNAQKLRGAQYVFPNKKYAIRHPLS